MGVIFSRFCKPEALAGSNETPPDAVAPEQPAQHVVARNAEPRQAGIPPPAHTEHPTVVSHPLVSTPSGVPSGSGIR